MTSFSINGATGVVNQTTKTIAVTLPSGTSVTSLIATFATNGSGVAVGSTPQVSGVTANNFTSPVAYVITAGDSSSSTYTVTVAVASSTAKAVTNYSLAGVDGIINETTKTIGVVLPAGTSVSSLIATFTMTGATLKVGGTTQVSGVTANNFTNPVAYVVTATDTSTVTYTVTVTVATTSAKALTSYSLAGVVGSINEAAKTISVVMPSGTAVSSLIATFNTTGSNVAIGGTSQVSATTTNNFTSPVAYVVTASDTSTTTYTVTVTVATTSAKALSSFSLGGIVGTINEPAKTIAVVMPSGTSLTSLIATFITTGSSVAIGGTTQVSGTTTNNFSSPVVYVVTAGDASTTSYTVTATVAPTTAKAFTGFSLGGVVGTINEPAKTISVVMPSGTLVTSLIATFTTTGASVAVGPTTQVSGTTANNFTNPVAFVVTAGDASTASYTVTVSVSAAGPAPVGLGSAGNFVLFAGTGISSSPDSAITGDVGVGPSVTHTAITTGFSLIPDGSGTFATASQVTGKVYAYDYTDPTPAYILSSSNDMIAAYNDAAGRPNPIVFGSANLDGLTLAPGLYKSPVSLNLSVNTTLTLNGGPNDVWIIQVAGGVTTGANTQIVLTGGAVAKNVFWQIQSGLTVGATSTFNGIILTGTAVTVGADSSIIGRLLSQTAITMDHNAITNP